VLLASCKEYEPIIRCQVNGTEVLIEGNGTVLAQYVNMGGGFVRSSVGGDNGNTSVNIRFDGNTPGNYSCGLSASGVIDVYHNGQSYTTDETGGSGNINVVQAGNNLIEGYFSGSLWSGTEEMVVTDGMFSGRAY